ncbi:lasso peptide biosynthesis B2 protein [Streptomyces sioyaensis]|uniref:lasso peptide biosynthesis B2 protein n=1 Tax=Streptomyces sioyaensis TaxID=67364 RepID=UPI0037A693A9
MQRPSLFQRLCGAIGFVIAVLMVRLPLRYTTMVFRLLHRLPLREPSPGQAEIIVFAARSAGTWWPGRAACMENSIAATVAAIVQGYRLYWCLGVRFMPPPRVYHAWVETSAGPIGEGMYTEDWPYRAALHI